MARHDIDVQVKPFQANEVSGNNPAQTLLWNKRAQPQLFEK
ncbi:MAG: hypothetical protein ACI94O_001705 [Octadecabacter sp.]|jgi:hypothetical protein